MKEFLLNKLFKCVYGNSKFTRAYCNEHKGEYEVFTGSTINSFAFIDSYEYESPNLTFSTDGEKAGTLTLIKNEKYNIGGHRAILIPLDRNLDLEYCYHLLKDKLFKRVRKGNVPSVRWTNIEDISIAIPTCGKTYHLDKQIELANIYKLLEEKKKKLLKRISELEELMIHIDIESDIEYKDVPLNELFEPQIGNSKYTKSYCKTNEGKYPIYSANTETEFANINRYDYDGEFITWAKDGLAGYLMILKNKFSITGHRGILIPKKVLNGIDLTYIKYTLEPIFRRHKKGREGDLGKNEYTTLNSTMIKKLNIQVPIPIKPDGTFDLEKQKEIANKYRQIDEIKQGLIDKIKSLVEIKVVPCE